MITEDKDIQIFCIIYGFYKNFTRVRVKKVLVKVGNLVSFL